MDSLQERYANFYTDFAFKKLFGTEVNKDLLMSFLNALLHGEETIKDLTFLNGEHLGNQEPNRRAVFDVYCENDRGEKVLIEMQKAEQQFFKDRSIFYSTFPIREQAKRGTDWNYKLKAVYTIGILNFKFDDTDPDYYHHEVKLMDTRTHEVFYDKLTYIYLEMPKFTKHEDELQTMFDKWMYAIRNLSTLLARPQALYESVFDRLFEVAEISKFNHVELSEYEDSLKVYRDWYSITETAVTKAEAKGLAKGIAKGMAEGMAKGMAKGMAEGMAEGNAKGKAKGKAEEKKEIASRLKRLGLPIKDIQQATNLSEEDIEKL